MHIQCYLYAYIYTVMLICSSSSNTVNIVLQNLDSTLVMREPKHKSTGRSSCVTFGWKHSCQNRMHAHTCTNTHTLAVFVAWTDPFCIINQHRFVGLSMAPTQYPAHINAHHTPLYAPTARDIYTPTPCASACTQGLLPQRNAHDSLSAVNNVSVSKTQTCRCNSIWCVQEYKTYQWMCATLPWFRAPSVNGLGMTC